jgi:pSer/pThr/pTyr-binding forkhead associated (FHA) protein
MQQLLSLKELRAMARGLAAGDFVRQLGPLALVKRPAHQPVPSVAASGLFDDLKATTVAPEGQVAAQMMRLALETEDLDVATLPPLRSVDELRIGRLPDCDLVIDDDTVSKRHAVLRWDQRTERSTLQDEGSTNGTFVNTAARLKGEVSLHDGDIVSFGDVAFWFLRTDTLHARLQAAKGSVSPRSHR